MTPDRPAVPHDPDVTIARESPMTPDLALLFARHVADMHADTPRIHSHASP